MAQARELSDIFLDARPATALHLRALSSLRQHVVDGSQKRAGTDSLQLRNISPRRITLAALSTFLIHRRVASVSNDVSDPQRIGIWHVIDVVARIDHLTLCLKLASPTSAWSLPTEAKALPRAKFDPYLERTPWLLELNAPLNVEQHR